MLPYGTVKTRYHVHGHQNCAICHPVGKEGRAQKKKARLQSKKAIERELRDTDPWRSGSAADS